MPITIKKKAAAAKRQAGPELAGTMHKVAGVLAERRKKLMPVVAAVLAGIVLVAGYSLVQAGRNAKAEAGLMTAHDYFHPAAGALPDYSKALDLYRDIQKRYSGTRGGATAQYYVGNSLVGLGRHDEGLKEYQYFEKKYSGEKFLLGLVYQRMGYLYTALGNRQEAVRSFERSEALTGTGMVTIELARLYESEGRTEESQKKYKSIIEKMPGSQWSLEAMTKVRQPASAPESADTKSGQ